MEIQTTLIPFLFALLQLTDTVHAKFCAFELNGEKRYYRCLRNEYCCNFGCCVSPAFQFYQLWYYWLLVIFMFLLCSGGGWWYRYWLQSRYRTCPGTILPITNSNSRHSRVPIRATSSQPRRSASRLAHISYNPSRDAVARVTYNSRDGVARVSYNPSTGSVQERVYKGPRNCPPPSYSSTQGELSAEAGNLSSPYRSNSSRPPASASSLFPQSHIAHSSAEINGQECPYYQLYGPPPNYDSVMSEIGNSSLPLVSSVQPADTSTTEPQKTNVASTTDVITSQQRLAENAATSHQNDNCAIEETRDNSSITASDVHTGCALHCTNVQNNHSDICKQTLGGESNN